MESLKRRAEFKAVAGGQRIPTAGFLLQVLKVAPAALEADARLGRRPPRFGFTVTTKIGNAVVRNRIRRRLREVVRSAEHGAEKATDYVLVARRPALTLTFERLVTDLLGGFATAARSGSRAAKSANGPVDAR